MSAQRHIAVAEDLGCVRTADLGCADPSRCWSLGFCGMSRDDTKNVVRGKPEPTRVKRIVDKAAIKRKMRGERTCRCGCRKKATDAHHILPRSLGGDDVEANVCGLDHDDHMMLEHFVGGDEVRREVGKRLRDDEIRYVLDKLAARAFADVRDASENEDRDEPGWEFLARNYGVERREIERS